MSYLLGIELMPRIRYWRKLKFYRATNNSHYRSINSLFDRAINWPLIEEYYPQFMQLSLAIQSGALAPSAVLAHVDSYSNRNRFAAALQELGRAVRTTFLLQWIWDEPMRHAVHKSTTKIERHHRFAKFLSFGGDVLRKTNDPAEFEKAIVYNELVANAVALQNVVDQTQALHQLRAEGIAFNPSDVTFMSPYPTGKVKRFGNYSHKLTPDPMPPTKMLPN